MHAGIANGCSSIGHVLTRVVCKGSAALGMLGEHEYELEVLETLLAQRRWRRGRRGRWHERRALLLMKFKEFERAKKAVIEALEDEDTHIGESPSKVCACCELRCARSLSAKAGASAHHTGEAAQDPRRGAPHLPG